MMNTLVSPVGTLYAFKSESDLAAFLTRQLPNHGFVTFEEWSAAKRAAYEEHRREYRKVNPILEVK